MFCRTDRKEFSNDPTIDIEEIWEICEQKMSIIQTKLDLFLKALETSDDFQNKVWTALIFLHFILIFAILCVAC